MATHSGIDAEIAFGEAIGTSFLFNVVLKSLVQKGIFSNAEVTHLIDHALLSLERAQGNPQAPQKTVERARTSLASLLQAFSESRPTR